MLAYGRVDETAGETAYRRIRSDIVFGRLAPGLKLRLERLKASYGASVTTLRELLNRLATEGFIRAEGQRGFEVTPISAANLREIAAMRVLLEGHAIDLSFAASQRQRESELVPILVEPLRSVPRDRREVLEADSLSPRLDAAPSLRQIIRARHPRPATPSGPRSASSPRH